MHQDAASRKVAWDDASLLLTLVSGISTARNVKDLALVFRASARPLLGADGVTLVLREGEKVHYMEEEAIGPLWKGRKFPLNACISGWVMANRKHAVVPDIHDDARIPLEAYRSTFVKSLLMVPVGVDQPVAAMGAYWASNHQATAREVELLQALASVAWSSLVRMNGQGEVRRPVTSQLLPGPALEALHAREVALQGREGAATSREATLQTREEAALFRERAVATHAPLDTEVAGWARAKAVESRESTLEQRDHTAARREEAVEAREEAARLREDMLRTREKAELDRRDAEAARQQTEEFYDQLVAVVGHDLKNPLTAVLVSARTLLTRANLPAPDAKHAGRIVRSAERMEHLVGLLLDYSRIRRNGTLPLQRERVELAEICRQIIDEQQASHPEREIRFEAPAALVGNWDGERLGQVFSNLIGNALQHGTADTPVAVRIYAQEQWGCVEVKNGGTIPAELLPHIFKPFRSGNSARSTGLGLFISEQLVVAHGGKLAVRSTPEEGTVFAFHVPLKAPLAP